MPVLRGIDVKLVTYPAKQIIEEYPHPDGSSLRLVNRQGATSAIAQGLSMGSPSPATSGPAVPGRKVDPKTSVYIATQPGSQFIIAYDISKVPEGCRYMNFKILINGRHVVTCGRDLEERRRGVISRTLWAPSDQWSAQAGIEGRQFVFLLDETAKSAAEDGGLIEVQVHRAEARTSCAPALREFRQARHYGLATPSTGLIEKPQEVEWYKYRLIDPIDIPYARFYFHYRSLESLKDLSLIPDVSVDESNHAPEKKTPQLPEDAPEKETRQMSDQQSPNEGRDASQSMKPEYPFLWIDGASDDRRVSTPSSMSEQQRRAQSIRAPPQGAQFRRRENAIPPVPANRTTLPAPILQRPLPSLPLDPVAHTRTTAGSPAPSLTPSLKRSVDDGVFDRDIEIAETEVVRYRRVHKRPTLLEVSSARNSTLTSGRQSTGTNVPAGPSSGTSVPAGSLPGTSVTAARNVRQNVQHTAGRDLGHDSDSSSDWSETEHATALSPPPQMSYMQRRALEQSQRDSNNRPLEAPSRPPQRPHATGMMQGVMDHEHRHRPQPLSFTVPTYRGADTTMQSQVRRSPQRARPLDLQLSLESYAAPQQPATYSALRNLGNQMLGGATSRRNTDAQPQPQVQPQVSPDRGLQPLRIAQILSPERGERAQSSRPPWATRSPNPRPPWATRPTNPTTTPTRPSMASQRWSPRNARPDPRRGVSWEEVVRQSPRADAVPRTDAVIDHMITQLGRSERAVNRSDSSKENRPPRRQG